MKIGSLCTGYGGLDMAVEAYFDAETIWVSEIDKYASQIIQAHSDLPNLGDLKKINWDEVEPIDILTAGYPCQPFSSAGQRKGSKDERHLWPYIKDIIGKLRPSIVILENVRGHLSLGFKEVLADLTELGYDAKWQIVRASDVGAPHQRARLFIVAYPSCLGCEDQLCHEESVEPVHSVITHSKRYAREESRRTDRSVSGEASEILNRTNRDKHGIGCEAATNSHYSRGIRPMQGLQSRFNSCREMSVQVAPNTLDGLKRLNPEFVEYMMGLPTGWVTDCGLSRSQQLKILGNGVVPQQAFYALELLIGVSPCVAS